MASIDNRKGRELLYRANKAFAVFQMPDGKFVIHRIKDRFDPLNQFSEFTEIGTRKELADVIVEILFNKKTS